MAALISEESDEARWPDQLPRLVDRAFDIERQSRVGLGRNAPRHDFKNVGAKLDKEMIANVFDLLRAAQT